MRKNFQTAEKASVLQALAGYSTHHAGRFLAPEQKGNANLTREEQAHADEQMRTEIARQIAQTVKINKGFRFHEIIFAIVATMAIVAFTKAFL